MPIYEYRCASCGHELEALQKLSDATLTHCPACDADTLTKLVSAAGFQLKGSGWYATDFRNAQKPGAAAKKPESESTNPAETKSDSKSETSTESKSEAKAETKGESKSDGGSNTKPSDGATNARASGT